MIWIHAITPLHVGAGKGVGFIDMPITREKVTGWPYIPGSAIKGVIRDHMSTRGDEKQKEHDLINTAFGKDANEKDTNGKDTDEELLNSGSLVFTDAHIALFPVRSLYGTFAYVTCPFVLQRLSLDMKNCGYSNLPAVPHVSENDALVPHDACTAYENRIFFEDLDFSAKKSENADEWAKHFAHEIFRVTETDASQSGYAESLMKRFVIVSDDVFSFLSTMGTDVSAHIRIDQKKKVVERAALWYEESLPSEAVLTGMVWCDRIYGKQELKSQELLNLYCSKPLRLQIGGKATVGKGIVSCQFSGV